MTVIAAFKHLKLDLAKVPHGILHFGGKTHKADADGVIRDVPHDTAVILIKNGSAEAHVDADADANKLMNGILDKVRETHGAAAIICDGVAGDGSVTFRLVDKVGNLIEVGTLETLSNGEYKFTKVGDEVNEPVEKSGADAPEKAAPAEDTKDAPAPATETTATEAPVTVQ